MYVLYVLFLMSEGELGQQVCMLPISAAHVPLGQALPGELHLAEVLLAGLKEGRAGATRCLPSPWAERHVGER